MKQSTVIATDRDPSDTESNVLSACEPHRAPIPYIKVNKSGWWYHWGPQAWIDMWMSNAMLVKKAMLIITHTFLPILRLSGDGDKINEGFADVRSRQEKTNLFDSPREKWRKRYGNFVREVEWALLELRKHFSQKQYEEIVIGTCVALFLEGSPDFLKKLERIAEKEYKPTGSKEPGKWQQFIVDTFNPAGWLTGPAKITEFNGNKGLMVMEIPDCAWHTCAKCETLPNPNALPEEGCLMICKGTFEALFTGEQGGLKFEFDPHLPETSCTMRMSW